MEQRRCLKCWRPVVKGSLLCLNHGGVAVTKDVTVTEMVTSPVTPTRHVTDDVTGDHECPICGMLHHKPLSAAERKQKQRAKR
jgi:hypothetical protein